MNEPSIYDIVSSMASRRKEMETIREAVEQLEIKIKQLNKKREELKSLNYLDAILLQELSK